VINASVLSSKFGSYSPEKGGSELLFRCPECGHRALMINPRKGKGHCFRCDFIPELQKVRDDPFERPLYEFQTATASGRTWIGIPDGCLPMWKDSFVNSFEKEEHFNALGYFTSRGFTKEDAEKYGVQFCPRGKYGGRIVFPITRNGVPYTFIARDYRNRPNVNKVLHPENFCFSE